MTPAEARALRVLCAAVALSLLVIPATAQEAPRPSSSDYDKKAIDFANRLLSTLDADRVERFRLYNRCRPVELVIEPLDDHAAGIGLTEERIRSAAESRLRGARLYADLPFRTNFAELHIRIKVGGASGMAYSMEVQYRKWLSDAESGESGRAMTWESGAVGTHGRDAGHILQFLAEVMDRFLAAYLRVNEADCGGPMLPDR